MTDTTLPAQLRHSHGLEQFFSSLHDEGARRILDLGELTQVNVTYITGLGIRLYSENFLQTMDTVFGPGDPLEKQSDAEKASTFLSQVLQYDDGYFDAVLVWDTLEHLSPPLLHVVMERLQAILRRHAVLLACFHPDNREESVPVFSYRIADNKTLQLHPRGKRKAARKFNNRAIEKIFEGFHSVKFFLTRDNLREVIVKR